MAVGTNALVATPSGAGILRGQSRGARALLRGKSPWHRAVGILTESRPRRQPDLHGCHDVAPALAISRRHRAGQNPPPTPSLPADRPATNLAKPFTARPSETLVPALGGFQDPFPGRPQRP